MPQSKLLAIALIFTGLQSKAQFRIPVTNNDLRSNLSSVITDYPRGFSTLRGDTLSIDAQTVVYNSTLDFKGAEHSTIVEYRALQPVYSWQGLLLSTDDFEEAAKKYKWLINQLKVMTVKVEDYSFTLSGDFNEPDESKQFCSSIFKLTPNASNMPKLKVEASLEFVFPAEWHVRLLVYEREREDTDGEVMTRRLR